MSHFSPGSLTVIHGSMFSGKTEHVIALLRHAESEGKRVAAFKHAIDDRYAPDHLVTHPGDKYPAMRAMWAQDVLERCGDAEIVAIDEGHFFNAPLIPVARELRERGVEVFVTGISNDAWGRPFEPIPQLIELADEVVLLQAACRVCGEPSPFTQRLTDVETLHMVGGVGDYEPRCREHFLPLPGPPEKR